MFCASPSRRWALFSCGSCQVYGNRRTLLSAQWMIKDAWVGPCWSGLDSRPATRCEPRQIGQPCGSEYLGCR